MIIIIQFIPSWFLEPSLGRHVATCVPWPWQHFHFGIHPRYKRTCNLKWDQYHHHHITSSHMIHTIERVDKFTLLFKSQSTTIESLNIDRIEFQSSVTVFNDIVMLAKVSETSGTVGEEDRVSLEADGLCIQTNGFFVILASEQAVSFALQCLSSFGTFLNATQSVYLLRYHTLYTRLPLDSRLQ